MSRGIDRQAAVWMMAHIGRMNASASELTDLISKVDDPLLQKGLRKKLGELIIILNIEVMRPIVRDYADLDPDAS